MTIAVFDERKCSLGEGAFWHPEREQLFWFDINAKQLLTQGVKGPDHWQFEEHVSAAGWVEKAILLVASSKALIRFNIETGDQTVVCELALAPVNQKCLILVQRSCQEPALAIVNRKYMVLVQRSCEEPGLAPVNQNA